MRRVHFNVAKRVVHKLDAARDGLSHSIPNATTEQVLQAALRLLLEKQARSRGQVKKPRSVVPTTAPTRTSAATPTGISAKGSNQPICNSGSLAIPISWRRRVG